MLRRRYTKLMKRLSEFELLILKSLLYFRFEWLWINDLWRDMEERKRCRENSSLSFWLQPAVLYHTNIFDFGKESHRNFLNTQASPFLYIVHFYGFRTCKNKKWNPHFVLLRHGHKEKVFAAKVSWGTERCFRRKWVLLHEFLGINFGNCQPNTLWVLENMNLQFGFWKMQWNKPVSLHESMIPM